MRVPDTKYTTTRIVAPARLHFGLIDLSGQLKHADGGIGLAIQQPSITITASISDRFQLQCPDSLHSRAEKIINRIGMYLRTRDLNIKIDTTTIPHSGFGSGTQLSLALSSVLLALVGLRAFSLTDLSVLLQRGGTSGIGVHAFNSGGLLVDGGRYWPHKQPKFGPSSAFSLPDIPPLIARVDFPDWGICIVVPNLTCRISDESERSLFKSLTPVPVHEVKSVCSLILLKLLPAIANSNFELFCESLEEIRDQGFKRREICSRGAIIVNYISSLEEIGFRGVGMSSWGPALFGFTPTLRESFTLSQIVKEKYPTATVVTTQAKNTGHELRYL